MWTLPQGREDIKQNWDRREPACNSVCSALPVRALNAAQRAVIVRTGVTECALREFNSHYLSPRPGWEYAESHGLLASPELRFPKESL